jgi:hypothetical protein
MTLTQSVDSDLLVKIPHFLAAMLTPVIAIVGGMIGIQQWHLSRARFRYELFDRRYQIFEKLAEFMALAGQLRPDLTHERTFQFLRDTKRARFLFGKEIGEYIDLVYRKAIALISCQSQIKDAPVGPERTRLVNEQSQILTWFDGELKTIEDRFEKYLGLLGEVAFFERGSEEKRNA